jgi:hypothetical protein
MIPSVEWDDEEEECPWGLDLGWSNEGPGGPGTVTV